MLLRFAFREAEEGVYVHTSNNGKLFKLACLREKTNVRTVLIREMLFTDGTALTTHTEHDLEISLVSSPMPVRNLS